MQEARNPLKLAKAISTLEANCTGQGLSVRLDRDFELLEDIRRGFKKPLTEHFSPKHNTFAPADGFWIGLYDEGNACVGTAAARRVDLTGMTLDTWLRRYWERVYRYESTRDFRFHATQNRITNLITGRVAYLGELVVKEQFRRHKLASHLTLLAKLAAFELWDYDYVYAFMENHTVKGGLNTSTGFAQSHRYGIRWLDGTEGPSQVQADNWMLLSSRSDVLDLIEHLSGEWQVDGRM